MDGIIYHGLPPYPTSPRSLTAARGTKRPAESQDPQPAEDPPTRRVTGMFASIPHYIWACGSNVVCGFLQLFKKDNGSTRPPQAGTPPTPTTHIEAVATDHSGRKRRAVEAHAIPTPPDNEEYQSPDMSRKRRAVNDRTAQSPSTRTEPRTREHVNTTPPAAARASYKFTSSFADNDHQRRRRLKWYNDYYAETELERRNRAKRPTKPQDGIVPSYKSAAHGRTSLRESQIEGLLSKVHKIQGGSFAQKAAEQAAREQQERKEASQKEAEEAEAERVRREKEAAVIAKAKAEAEAERIRAEEEAARAHEIIVELPEDIMEKLHNSMAKARQDREHIITLGSFPLGKISFVRTLAEANGTNSWLDDDTVNAWYHAIVEAKNRQDGFVKSATSVPKFSTLNTGWFTRATKEGPASLSRWIKRAGVGGKNLLKCDRFFLPINMGSHWTLLIINGTDRSIEYLDSLGGDGGRYFTLAREMLKAELGNDFHAGEWTDLKRNRSSAQNNMSDCGVFTCFNGLAAAKARPYKEISAKKMPLARKMLAGVLINGGFEGDFDL